jgi:hypothetical protein
MSKLYIFAIGGTGSRVLRSLTMLLASGVDMSAKGIDTIVPIIIDPDFGNADLTRTVDTLRKYCKIRENLSFSASNRNKFFKEKISDVLDGYRFNLLNTNSKLFSQFINIASMDRENQAMTKALFSRGNLDSNMNVGFKGNPNIGSVVLNQIVESPDFEVFANGFSKGDKIFIISSIFGGTGASGFPLLLKTLRTNKKIQNFALINQSEIGAVTVLPYFALKSNSDSAVDSSTFISKAKSALAYYEDNIAGQIEALYFVADDIYNNYENVDGGENQKNDAHLIELLSASSIVDFSNKEHKIGDTKNFEFGLKDSVSEEVSFNDFYDTFQSDVLKPMIQLVLFSNCFKSQKSFIKSGTLNANRRIDNYKDFYNSPFVKDLESFLCNEFLGWLGEMNRNIRHLHLCEFDKSLEPFDVIKGIHSKKLFSTKSGYNLFFDRLNREEKHCDRTSKSNDKLVEMYYLATKCLVQEKFNF